MNWRVSLHAVQQYCDPNREGRLVDAIKSKVVTDIILRRMARAKEVQLPPEEAFKRLANNGFQEARYWLDSGMLFVTIDDQVATCYPYKLNAKRRKALQ